MGRRQSNEREFGREAKDQTGLTHSAVWIGTVRVLRMRFLVLVIVMANMLGHRVLLMLAIGTHRRCSRLQRHHSNQNEGNEGSHDAEV